MRLVARSIALAVAVSLLVGGPLATFAIAQQPTQQPAEAPAPPPAEPPRLAQETMEEKSMEDPSEPSAWYNTGAAIANVVFIPGKVVTCALGIVVGGSLLIITFGAAYKGATAFGKEGCGGKWFLTGDDLKDTDWILGSGDRPERN